jgi:dTDP-4-amino-4,6-dideoxygalactose transaminase
VPEWADPVWHLFVIRNLNRDNLQKGLTDSGVGTLIHYPVPPHLSDAYSEGKWRCGSFPIAELFADNVLSLPLGPHLTDALASDVVLSLKNICEDLAALP